MLTLVFSPPRPARRTAVALAAALIFATPAAMALQVKTSWHLDNQANSNPHGHLDTPVIAAAVRNNHHIYELHLVCGRGQYNKAAPGKGAVLELLVSTYTGDKKKTPIHTTPGNTKPGEKQPGAGINIGLKIGQMPRVTQRFRAKKHPNVVSAVFFADTELGNDGQGPNASAQLVKAARGSQGITVSNVLDHETVSVPFSQSNKRVAQFLKQCPTTANH